MGHEQLWALERNFWRGGTDVYDQCLAPQVLMVFPSPAGIMDRGAIMDSISKAPRWADVTVSNQRAIAPVKDVVVLAYDARAHRDVGGSEYRAHCSSTFIRMAGEWKLVGHQQAPDSSTAVGDEGQP